MSRREWNVPVVEADPDYAERTQDGVRGGVRAAFCDDDIEMFRQGYKCIDCWELFDSAFPDECFVCGFPVKAEQARMFEERFAGHRETGSRIDEGLELDRLAQQREDRERREGLKAKGIVVPRSVRL